MSRGFAGRIRWFVSEFAIALGSFILLKLSSKIVPGVDVVELCVLVKTDGGESSIARDLVKLF